MEITIGILILGVIACYYFFREMKKDYKKELEDIKNENTNLE